MAHSEARKIFMRSIRAALAIAIATWALAKIRSYSSCRLVALSFLESFIPLGISCPSKMTAAATTGPASGPRPASSMPATRRAPRFKARRSNSSVGAEGSSISEGESPLALAIGELGPCPTFRQAVWSLTDMVVLRERYISQSILRLAGAASTVAAKLSSLQWSSL